MDVENSWKRPGSPVTPEFGGKGGRRITVCGRRTTWFGLTLGFRIGITAGGLLVRIVVFIGLVVVLGLAVVVVVVLTDGRGVVVVLAVVLAVVVVLVVVVLGLVVVVRGVIWTMPGSLGVGGCEESGRRGVDGRDLSLPVKCGFATGGGSSEGKFSADSSSTCPS